MPFRWFKRLLEAQKQTERAMQSVDNAARAMRLEEELPAWQSIAGSPPVISANGTHLLVGAYTTTGFMPALIFITEIDDVQNWVPAWEWWAPLPAEEPTRPPQPTRRRRS